jgi:hypothetical protein
MKIFTSVNPPYHRCLALNGIAAIAGLIGYRMMNEPNSSTIISLLYIAQIILLPIAAALIAVVFKRAGRMKAGESPASA